MRNWPSKFHRSKCGKLLNVQYSSQMAIIHLKNLNWRCRQQNKLPTNWSQACAPSTGCFTWQFHIRQSPSLHWTASGAYYLTLSAHSKGQGQSQSDCEQFENWVTLAYWYSVYVALSGLKCKWSLSWSCRFSSTCIAPAVEMLLSSS